MKVHCLGWQKHSYVFLCQFFWRGGTGLERAVNKEQKDVAKGLCYLEVRIALSLDLSAYLLLLE